MTPKKTHNLVAFVMVSQAFIFGSAWSVIGVAIIALLTEPAFSD